MGDGFHLVNFMLILLIKLFNPSVLNSSSQDWSITESEFLANMRGCFNMNCDDKGVINHIKQDIKCNF